MAIVVALSLALALAIIPASISENNFTDVSYDFDDVTNSTEEPPEITIFQADKRSDKEKFSEAIKSARKKWNGDYAYQRDIRISKAQLAHLYGVDRTKDETSYTWPNATVPFFVGRKVINYAKDIKDAMRQWEKRTCVRFVELKQKPNATTDHVRFVQSYWAYSYLGKQGGVQKVGIPSIYFPHTHYVHLLGHTLGLRHTHAAGDRDALYHVAWNSVPERYRYNFDRESPAYGPTTKIDALESEFGFDWSSVMADESEAVENAVDHMEEDRRVLYPADPFYLYRTTATEHASFLEYKRVNQLYNCSGGCPNANARRCQHGGYLGPRCSCDCPPGTVGDQCEHRATTAMTDICGEVVQTNKTINVFSGPSAEHCTWWIRAPEEKARASVTFTGFSVDNTTHGVGSCELYFELRTRDLYKGERYCWYEVPLDVPLYARGKDFLIDYFGPKDASFNFTLKATVDA